MNEVVGILGSLASRRRRQACVMAALALAGAAVLVLLAVAAWDVASPLPWKWRTVARIVVPAAMLVAWLQWVLRRGRRATAERMAAELEGLNPALGQKLRTAVEIQTRGIPEDAAKEYQILAGRVVREGNLAAAAVDLAPVLATHRLRLMAAVGLFLAVMTVFLATRPNDYALALKRVAGVSERTYTELGWHELPEFHDDRHPARIALKVGGRAAEPVLEVRTAGTPWKRVALTPLADGLHDVILTDRKEALMLRASAGDAKLAPVVVPWMVVPRLVAAGTVVRFPDYTGLEMATAQGGDVEAVEGSEVAWEFRFSAAPAAIQWQIEGDSPETHVADGEHVVRPAWTVVAGERQATLTLLDRGGQALDAWRYRLTGVPDALPVVELLDPAKDREATAVTEFPVRIRAKDDFGLAEVGLILDSAGNRDWVLEQVVEAHNERDINQVVTAMLEKVPLDIRDNVRLHAYALDHKPRGGPRAVSALRSIDIREFKKRSRFIPPEPRSSDPQAEREAQEEQRKRAKQINELIGRLDEIIKRQRGYTSDLFGIDQSGEMPPKDRLEALHRAEDTLHRSAVAMEERWNENPGVTADDLALLSTAADQLRDSARAILVPNPNGAFVEGDAALANLLQLRKNLIELMTKSQGMGEPVPDPPRDVKELAREARRLAKEERDVKGQLEPVDPQKLPAARRQQEVAVHDGGELFSAIVTHHERSEGALELMAEAEKRMNAAETAIFSAAPESAAPLLEAAAVTLLELADFLDSMDLNQLPQTLERMAEKAREDQRKQAEAEAEGEGEGEGEGKESKPKAGEAEELAKRNAELADKTLEQLLEDLRNGGAKDEEMAERLEGLRERNDLEQLAKELHALGQLRREGGGDARDRARMGKGAGRRLDQLARDLQAEADRLKAGRLRQLLEAKERAEELKRELAGGGKDGEGAGEKGGDKPGGKEGEVTAQGEGEPGKPGEIGRQGGGRAEAFAGALDGLGDGDLNRIAGRLREGTFDRNSLPLIEEAEQRIRQLIDEFPRPDHEAIRRSRIPEAYRREIEDYYRDLSNDIQDD